MQFPPQDFDRIGNSINNGHLVREGLLPAIDDSDYSDAKCNCRVHIYGALNVNHHTQGAPVTNMY